MVLDARMEIDGRPSIGDVFMYLTGALQFIVHSGLDNTRQFMPARPHDSSAAYDAGTQSWSGTDGLRYRVPLMDLPSEHHCRMKRNNIKIVLNNVQELAVKDKLPATAQEQRFWREYQYVAAVLFLKPFCVTLPPLYLAFRRMQHAVPNWSRGRIFPLLGSSLIASEWKDYHFPAQQLLHQAMMAQTPLGDAARAEWLRLQPVHVSQTLMSVYTWKRWIGEPYEELMFGGDTKEVESWM